MKRPLQAGLAAAGVALLVACSLSPTPEPTPVPTTFPVAAPDEATTVATAYLEAWAAGDYAAMYDMDRLELERFTPDGKVLLESYKDNVLGQVGQQAGTAVDR